MSAEATASIVHAMAPYLDPHLLLPVLNHLQEAGAHVNDDLIRAKIEMLRTTMMVNYESEMYGELGEAEPADLQKRRDDVMARIQHSQAAVQPLLEVLVHRIDEVRACGTADKVLEKFQLDESVLDALYDFALVQYNCGSYEMAHEALKHYRQLLMAEAADSPLAAPTKMQAALWGCCSSAILAEKWDPALDAAAQLDDMLEKEQQFRTARERQVACRSWWSHWMLYLVFHSMGVVSQQCTVRTLDLFFSRHHLASLAVATPHLLRYVAAAVILHKKAQGEVLQRVVGLLQLEAARYSDPVTKLLTALYVDLDFDSAQAHLEECEAVVQDDFFLSQRWDDFCQNARLLIFEIYCRIHQTININMVAEKLHMQADEAETWIVRLIQSARLEAKIDSEKNRVVMDKADMCVFQQVLDLTKNVGFKTMLLLSSVSKQQQQQQQQQAAA